MGNAPAKPGAVAPATKPKPGPMVRSEDLPSGLPTLRQLVQALGPQIERTVRAAPLPPYLTPERFYKTALNLIVNHADELVPPKVTEESLLLAILDAATMGLELGGPYPEATIVRFGNTAKFMPMWPGLVKKAREGGVVRNIVPRVVYEGDFFEYEYGINERLVHRPSMEAGADLADRITYAYAIATFVDGGPPDFEVMSRAQIEQVRARSKAANKGPWVTDYAEMSRKSPVRRIYKRLPVGEAAARLAEYDRRLEYEGRVARLEPALEIPTPDALVARTETRTEAVRGRLAARAGTRAGGEAPAGGNGAPPAQEAGQAPAEEPRQEPGEGAGAEPPGPDAGLAGRRVAYGQAVREKGWNDDARHGWELGLVGKPSEEWGREEFDAALARLGVPAEARHPATDGPVSRPALIGLFRAAVERDLREVERPNFLEYMQVSGLTQTDELGLATAALQKWMHDDPGSWTRLLGDFRTSPLRAPQ